MKSFLSKAVGFGIISALHPFAVANAEVRNNDLLKITVTGTRSEETIKDYSGSVDVITKDDLLYKPKFDLRDVFNDIPGVTTFSGVRGGSGGVQGMPGLNNINIRGMEGDRNLFVIDGIRLPDRYEYGGYYEIGRTQYVDFNFLKSIEILRGSSSSLWGPDALGGVVSYRSLDPQDFLSDDDFAIETSSVVSNKDNGVVTSLKLANQISPKLSSVIAYTYETAGDLNTKAKPEYQNDSSSYGNNYFANIVYDISDESRISMKVEDINRSSETSDSDSNLPTNISKLDSYTDTKRTRFSIDFDYENLEDYEKLFDKFSITAYAQSSRVDDDYTRSGTSRGRPISEYRDHNLVTESRGANAKVTSPVLLGDTEHLLTWGFDYSELEASRTRTINNLLTSSSSQEKETPDSTITRLGLYLQDSISVGNFDLLASIRFDDYNLDAENDAIYVASSNNRTDFAADQSHQSITPKISVAYNIDDLSNVYFSYSKGFRPGAWYEINTSYDNLYCANVFACGVTTESNPDLKPETSNNFEIGYKSNSNKYNLSAAAYYNNYDNFIESLVSTGRRDSRGYAISKTLNVGEAQIYGVEVAGKYFWGTDKTGFNIGNSLSYSVGDDLVANEPLVSVVPFTNRLTLGYLDPNDVWSASLGMTTVGKPRLSDSYSNFIPDGFTTFDANAYWNINDNLTATLGIYNLFDKRYYNFQDVRSVETNYASVTRFSQPGRSVQASFTFKF